MMEDILCKYLLTLYFFIFQSRDADITFQLTPAIYLSKLRYVIRINSSSETRSKDLQKENGNYKTDNVKVSYGGKYFLLYNQTLLC